MLGMWYTYYYNIPRDRLIKRARNVFAQCPGGRRPSMYV